MATYSYQRPVNVTADGTDEKYKDDHLKHYFENDVYHNIMSFSPEEKEQYFKLQRDYGWWLHKVLALDENVFPLLFLSKSLENGVDDILVNQYKEWLEKQNV